MRSRPTDPGLPAKRHGQIVSAPLSLLTFFLARQKESMPPAGAGPGTPAVKQALIATCLLLLAATTATAQRISDVRGTKHNLSATSPNAVRAAAGATNEVCVFCHTPHGATQADLGGNVLRAPLWNRRVPDGATYTPYTSSSMDAQAILDGFNATPGGSSKLCLSCHDGTLAIGNVNVLNGNANPTIAMQGTSGTGTMPAGEGTGTGFTRFLGTDLTNDHPISLSFTAALAVRDGELHTPDGQQRWPAGSGSVIGLRSAGNKPLLPLEPTGSNGLGQVQCATCHDPHLREQDASKGNQKFLRAQRFQEAAPGASHNPASDTICLGCHDKSVGIGVWAMSAHARPEVADETYRDAAAQLREFPLALPVWKAGCLNCHDTHTVQGARRLTREGSDGAQASALAPRQAGNPALENTCYQCHTTAAKSALTSTLQVPDIESEFQRLIRMPIVSAEQEGGGAEPHDPTASFTDGSIDCSGTAAKCGADLLEPRSRLAQRHAECTDCHNPHRVVKFRSFTGGAAGLASTPDPAGTHRHDDAAGYTHSNLISGVLRGTWGVEPQYGSTSFQQLPGGYTVKRGDPGASVDTSVGASHVTREYQICLKCHSDYGYADNNVYPNGNRPALGRTGGTPLGSNGLTIYTNQAKEFQAPASHQGEGTKANSGAGSAYAANNHRSWHPVMGPTGRNGANAAAFRLPWGNAIGSQTMYCSDCHGSNTADTTVVPPGGDNGTAWGPHGSNNNFLLKGLWNTSVGADNRGDNGPNANGLCFKCHNPNTYANRNGSGTTGFFNGDRGNLHAFHTDKIGRMRCNWCHVAVPHGWKNKALLVNLNDVGPEAGRAGNEEWRFNASAQAYNQQPYYLNAKLKVRTFATSGNWIDTNCGSNASAATFGANGNDTQNGKNWMQDVCSNPP
jgi:Doubled CXXCH motif (Paired_CXXCH_1)